MFYQNFWTNIGYSTCELCTTGYRIESIPPLIRHGTYLLVSSLPMKLPNKPDVKEELKCL